LGSSLCRAFPAFSSLSALTFFPLPVFAYSSLFQPISACSREKDARFWLSRAEYFMGNVFSFISPRSFRPFIRSRIRV
jgi:hypothetical protein